MISCNSLYFRDSLLINVAFPGESVVKNLPVNAGDVGLIAGSGRSPREGNDNPLQYFAWKIPWTGEVGGLQSVGSQRVTRD